MSASAVIFLGFLVVTAAVLILLGVRIALSARAVPEGVKETPETEPLNLRRVIILTALVTLAFSGVMTGIIAGCGAVARRAHEERRAISCRNALEQVQAALNAYRAVFRRFPSSMSVKSFFLKSGELDASMVFSMGVRMRIPPFFSISIFMASPQTQQDQGLTGFIFQTSSQYSMTVRSLENFPMRATFRIAIRAQ